MDHRRIIGKRVQCPVCCFKAVEVEMLREVEIEKMPSYLIGMEKGMEKVMEKGRDEGRKEGIEKVRQVAAKLLASGMSADEVMDMTDLSRDEVQALIAAPKHH